MGDDDMPDDNDKILELEDELEDIKNRIPMYTSKRAVGTNLVTPATGYSCQPCGQFFLSKDRADKHCRSETHYKSFVKILNDKHAQSEDKKRKQEEENDEGNWKRRKINDSENENIDEQEGQEGQDESKTEKDGNDLYDPADSFMSTDPNDVVFDSTAGSQNTTETDKVWDEVNKDLDDILDSTVESEVQDTSVVKSTPTKPKPAARTPRGRRGRKN